MLGSRQLVTQLPVDAANSAHLGVHVDGHADRPALVGNGPRDGLADPPGGVRAELESSAVFELLDGPHQSRIALLDQVEKGHAPIAVFLRHRDHQTKISLGKGPLGPLVLSEVVPQSLDASGKRRRRVLRLGHQPLQFRGLFAPDRRSFSGSLEAPISADRRRILRSIAISARIGASNARSAVPAPRPDAPRGTAV